MYEGKAITDSTCTGKLTKDINFKMYYQKFDRETSMNLKVVDVSSASPIVNDYFDGYIGL